MGFVSLALNGWGFLLPPQVGYLAFGEDTQDIITFNLSPGWSTPAVKAALCAGLLLTFPPMMIPVYQILETALAKKVCLSLFCVLGLSGVLLRSSRCSLLCASWRPPAPPTHTAFLLWAGSALQSRASCILRKSVDPDPPCASLQSAELLQGPFSRAAKMGRVPLLARRNSHRRCAGGPVRGGNIHRPACTCMHAREYACA